jgi:hypothetical protein
VQSLTLDELRRELARTAPKEAALIGEYVLVASALRKPTKSKSASSQGVTLRTLSDLLAFMLQLPAPDINVRARPTAQRGLAG